MQALVTGASGFIGSALVDRLLQLGVRVRCLVRPSSNLRWLKNLPVDYVYDDLTSPGALPQAVAGMDVVYHLAGVIRASRRSGYIKGNYQATLDLLEASEKYGPAHQKVVFVSSLAAAGPGGPGAALTEGDEPRPISIYGKSKLWAEQAVLAFSQRRPGTIIRPPVVYGPRDQDLYVLFKSIQRGVHLIPGRGRQQLSLVHVDDLLQGILLAAASDRANGRIYYISGDEPANWKTLGGILAQVLNRRAVPIHVPFWFMKCVSLAGTAVSQVTNRPVLLNLDKLREARQSRWLCSNQRAKDELGFRPAIGIREGLAATASWYKRVGWL
jgi:nucleoside-diphosphate-sugar epimerase